MCVDIWQSLRAEGLSQDLENGWPRHNSSTMKKDHFWVKYHSVNWSLCAMCLKTLIHSFSNIFLKYFLKDAIRVVRPHVLLWA